MLSRQHAACPIACCLVCLGLWNHYRLLTGVDWSPRDVARTAEALRRFYAKLSAKPKPPANACHHPKDNTQPSSTMHTTEELVHQLQHVVAMQTRAVQERGLIQGADGVAGSQAGPGKAKACSEMVLQAAGKEAGQAVAAAVCHGLGGAARREHEGEVEGEAGAKLRGGGRKKGFHADLLADSSPIRAQMQRQRLALAAGKRGHPSLWGAAENEKGGDDEEDNEQMADGEVEEEDLSTDEEAEEEAV